MANLAKLIFFSLLVLDVIGISQTQKSKTTSCTGSPTYSCAYTGTDVVQTPPAPFNVTSPVGTVVKEPVLSRAHIARVTGPQTGGGLCGEDNQFNATPSGGSYDVVSNTNGTMVQVKCAGGASFFIGFNPHTLQAYPLPPATIPAGSKCGGSAQFSRSNFLLAYCRVGTIIWKLTYQKALTNWCGAGVGNCPDPTVAPTWTTLYDLANCPKAQSTEPTSGSLLGVGRNDMAFTAALSWTGGQGTARYAFYYNPKVGCSTFDSQGNGVHPMWYNTKGVVKLITAVQAVWGIHDVTTNGTWVQISKTNCVGAGCGGDGAPVWEANTSTVANMGMVPRSGGHNSLSLSYYINNNNPPISKHPFTNPTQTTDIAGLTCNPCEEVHFNAAVNNDTTPLLGSTGSSPNGVWTTPYKNEVFGMSMTTATVWRYCKTYSSGTTATNFWAKNGIGAPDQPRRIFFFTSDMLGQLGKTSSGLNRWDVFACALAGQ